MGRYCNRIYKTKRRTRDLDQIFGDDLKSDESILKLENQPFDEYKPGLGQYYCIPCAKYFETEVAKRTHTRGQIHKRRVKDLRNGPYTIEEANAAAGQDVAKYLAAKEAQETKQKVPVVAEMLESKEFKKEQKENKMETE
ncbi:bud site selection protein 20 [Trichomonascus vanleenenianus]|uniref:Bud20p n=1 Tax=Trichomonascus vanleenenianus TaxID=2268995 RepID=UPI003EC9B44E